VLVIGTPGDLAPHPQASRRRLPLGELPRLRGEGGFPWGFALGYIDTEEGVIFSYEQIRPGAAEDERALRWPVHYAVPSAENRAAPTLPDGRTP